MENFKVEDTEVKDNGSDENYEVPDNKNIGKMFEDDFDNRPFEGQWQDNSDISKEIEPEKPMDFDKIFKKMFEGDSDIEPSQGVAEDQGDMNETCELPDEEKNEMGDGRDINEKEKKGGSYRDVKKTSDGTTHEVHHIPANSASHLERDEGPAIKMEKEDHRKTASCGNSKEAREYCEIQKKLIEQGKFREAVEMDIEDIREKFGDKYDDAIEEMMEYIDKLEQEGKING